MVVMAKIHCSGLFLAPACFFSTRGENICDLLFTSDPTVADNFESLRKFSKK